MADVHGLIIIAVKESQVLISVSGIIGGVNLTNDHIPGAWIGFQTQPKYGIFHPLKEYST